MLDKPSFVAFDLASAVFVTRVGLERCIQTVMAACDDDTRPLASGAMLGVANATLERVLIAHVSYDAFVQERAGARLAFERLVACGVPVIGVASFSHGVVKAIARRLDWPGPMLLASRAPDDDAPLYRVARAMARAHGLADEAGAFVSDDPYEVGRASACGCPRVIALVSPTDSVPADDHGIARARSMREVLRHLVPERRPLRGSTVRVLPRSEAS